MSNIKLLTMIMLAALDNSFNYGECLILNMVQYNLVLLALRCLIKITG